MLAFDWLMGDDRRYFLIMPCLLGAIFESSHGCQGLFLNDTMVTGDYFWIMSWLLGVYLNDDMFAIGYF